MRLISKKHRQGLDFAVLCTLHGYVLVSIDNDVLTRIISKTAKSVLLSICHPHRHVFRESRGLIHVVHFCAKNRAPPATCFAAAPLADRWPHLTWGITLPAAARLAFARQSCFPTHFAAVAIGALVRALPAAARLASPGMAACLHTLPLEYTTNVGCQGKYQVSSAKCQVFFFNA